MGSTLNSMLADYSSTLTEFYNSNLNKHPVYQNNRIQSRIAALRQHFPTTAQILGGSVFSALTSAYAKHFKSQQWDINLYGDQFSGFLAAQVNSARAEAFDWPAIAWLASLEFKLLQLYYADDLTNAKGNEAPKITVQQNYDGEADVDRLVEWLKELDRQHPWLTVNIDSHCFKDSGFTLQATRIINQQGFSANLALVEH